MALIQKISPIGLDKQIDKFQSYLYSKLDWLNYESYHRVYLNPDSNTRGSVPETYVGDGEYKEVLFTDKFSVSSFFLKSGRETIDEGFITSEISFIVQSNLADLYPGITHRADEELKNDVIVHAQNYSDADSFRLIEVLSDVNDVYREVNHDQVLLDNMSFHHVVRFVFEVKYTEDCCTNC